MSFARIPAQDWRKVDRALSLPRDAKLKEIADRWNAAKSPNQDRPAIIEDHRLIGLYGERSFARLFRLPMDLADRKYGNRRANFKLRNGWVVDVVTRTPIHGRWQPDLAVPANTRGRVMAWVLCVWLGPEYEPVFTGWITESEARTRGERKQFHKRGVENIVVKPEWLAPIGGLLALHDPKRGAALPPSWWTERAAELELLELAAKTTHEAKKEVPQSAQTTMFDLEAYRKLGRRT